MWFSYLTQVYPATDFSYTSFVVAFLLCLFIVALLVFLYRGRIENQPLKRAIRSIPSVYSWMLITLFILLAARLSRIPYLSMRILWIFFALLFIAHLVYMIRLYFRRSQEERTRIEKNVLSPVSDVKKYLPKKKKR